MVNALGGISCIYFIGKRQEKNQIYQKTFLRKVQMLEVMYRQICAIDFRGAASLATLRPDKYCVR